MNKNELLSKIWEEKRERVVITEPYPLGVKITLDERNFDFHHIVFGLLSLLLSDPEKAYEWSKYWGRTVVQAHPTKGLTFSFSILGSVEEKLGVFFSTEKKINPQLLLNEQRNKGLFSIILNNSMDLTIEGAVLQLERMIDELVWCYHLEKIAECTNPIQAYTKALEEVFSSGVKINFVGEQEILNSKISNPQLPVRIYGNILDKGAVPSVIGLIDEFPKKSKNNFTTQAIASDIKGELKNLESIIKTPGCLPSDRLNYSIDKAPVCVAITVGKKPHIGHLLQFTFANLVNIVFGGGEKLYLNVNNMGSRIAGLLAALASKQDISVDEVVRKIIDEEITDIGLVDSCYRKREMKGKKYQDGIAILNSFPEKLFENASRSMIESFKKFGIYLSYVKDSENKKEVEEIYKASNGGLPENGFRVIRYQHKGKVSMCVLQKNGCPTASTMRAAFVRKLVDQSKGNKDAIFIDAGRDVFDAEKILRTSSDINLLQFEGIGFGYGMEIASGTNGFAMSVDEFYQFLQKDNNLGLTGEEDDAILLNKVLTFFVLSRNMTAASFRHKVNGAIEKTGMSFFDYKNKESFVLDFIQSYFEMKEFKRRVKEIMMLLSGEAKESGDVSNESSKKRKELVNLAKICTCQEANKIILPLKICSLNRSYVALKNWLVIQDKSILGIERLLVDFSLKENRDIFSLHESFAKMGIGIRDKVPYSIFGKKYFMEEMIFISDLRRRGYNEEEIRHLATLYLNGGYCLIRKRFVFFDFINKVLESEYCLESLTNEDKKVIVNAIKFSLGMLGMFDVDFE